MDTPIPGVVKDSQQSHSNVTPKSAAFGSPIATQDSWTAPPRRRQAQQKAKASFLPDDDDDDEDQDEQNDNRVATDAQERFDGGPNLDFVSYDFDSGLKGDTDKDWDVYNQSPTPHASQAARLPPQSAQPVPRSNMAESSDEFSVLEALKKQPAAATTSKNLSKNSSHQKPRSQKQQRELAARDRPFEEGEKGSPIKDNVHIPMSSATRSLANSKVRLAALEVEGGTEAQKPEVEEPRKYDYSLPSSKNSSPAAVPAKKRAPTKKQPAKKPPTKPKTAARGARAATGGRARNAKPASDPPVQQSPEAQSDEKHNEDLSIADGPSIVTRPSQAASPLSRMTRRKLEPEKSVTEVQQEDVIMVSSDPFSSFPESDNTDDEDFECSRKMTPSNSRRRTRAVAADSAAAKEAKKKAESQPAAPVNVRREDAEDERANLDANERLKRQLKQPTKKTAVERAQAMASHAEPNPESAKEIKLTAEKSKKKASISERAAASTRTSKDKSEVKQENVMSSNADRVAKGEAKKPCQTSEPFKETNQSYRKPNVVAFGPGGPKNNGRSHRTTAIIDSWSRGQQAGPNNREQPAATRSQPSKEPQKAGRLRLNTAVLDRDSPTNDFAGDVEGGISRAARPKQSSGAKVVPDKSPMPAAGTKEIVPDFDAETTTFVYEAEPNDTSNEFVASDAEADTAVELAASSFAESRGCQDRDVEIDSEINGDGKAFNPLAQADIKHLDRRGQRTVLGEIDINYRTGPQDVPALIPHQTKRKLPDTMTVEERPVNQLPLLSRTGSLLESFPTVRMNQIAFNQPFGDSGRPAKKPKYNSAQAVRANKDAGHGRNLVAEPGGSSRGAGGVTGDDVFGPRKKSEPSGSSAFVQRLISNESADRGADQPAWMAPDPRDARAAPRQRPITISHPDKARSVAPENASRPQARQPPDDVGKRMLAALAPDKAQVPSPWFPNDDSSKSLVVGDTTKSPLGDTFEQRRAPGVDEKTRVWKKATEPYADSLGETMHKIVNTILRGLKTNEAAIGDVVDDYRNDGQRVVDRIADKHRKERLLVLQQQEQNRLQHVQTYREARHVTGTLLGKLESVDIDTTMAQLGKGAVTNRLEQLQQTLTDA